MNGNDPILQRKADTNIIIYNTDGTLDSDLAMYVDIFIKESSLRSVYWVIGGFTSILGSQCYLLEGNDRSCSPVSPHIYNEAKIDYSYIEPNLAVGSETVTHDQCLLKAEGFTHILNVSSTASICYTDITYLWKNLSDTMEQNLSDVLPECIGFINNALHEGGKILVHCQAGISRSVAVVMAYLMWSHRLTHAKAFDMVQRCRDRASPNIGFIGQLMAFEHTLKVAGYELSNL
jgi:predicted protein tyrosine phosphatase